MGWNIKSAVRLCEEFNTLVNELKKDKKILDKEKYPWLEDSDERNNDRQRNIRQIHRPRKVMFVRIRKERSERYDLQIEGCT